jgi:23S rRNA pseudouridine2604 synthase
MSADEKRINKYLADRGLCSRREAEDLILKGWVKVNGEILESLSYKVKANDKVTLSEEVEGFLKAKLTIVIHKPIGYVSAQAEEDYKPAITLATSQNYFGKDQPPKIFYKGFAPAGRLDIDSTGLLILTQNGNLAKKIIAPDSETEKEYLIKVKGEINPEKIQKLIFGLTLDGRKLKKAQIQQVSTNQLNFILKEGRKRQIRRMCELVDLQVLALKRIRIGHLKLGNLPVGMWRVLKHSEKI